MKKLILVSLLAFTSTLFANPNIGVSIQTPLGNGGSIALNFKSDDHRYDNRYRDFDYNRYGYADNFGYYYGYFDRTGYFYNNIFFLYDGRYTYYDRLHLRGNFKPHHPHYREYRYHKNNDWNRSRNYRNDREPVYGPYYQRNNHERNDYRQNNDRNQNNRDNRDSHHKEDKHHR